MTLMVFFSFLFFHFMNGKQNRNYLLEQSLSKVFPQLGPFPLINEWVTNASTSHQSVASQITL